MIISTILDGFYEEIKNRINSQVRAVKHFDLYSGQYDNPELDDNGNPLLDAFNCPAVFFEWPSLNLQPLGMRRKAVDCEFALHLVQDVVQEVSAREPEAIRVKGHAHTQLIYDLVVALEGFQSDLATDFKYFGPISWVALKPYQFEAGKTVHILAFKTRLVIDAATKFYTKLSDLTPPVTATDEISGDIEQL